MWFFWTVWEESTKKCIFDIGNSLQVLKIIIIKELKRYNTIYYLLFTLLFKVLPMYIEFLIQCVAFEHNTQALRLIL